MTISLVVAFVFGLVVSAAVVSFVWYRHECRLFDSSVLMEQPGWWVERTGVVRCYGVQRFDLQGEAEQMAAALNACHEGTGGYFVVHRWGSVDRGYQPVRLVKDGPGPEASGP